MSSAFDFFDQLIEVLIPFGKEGRILIGSCLNSIAVEFGSCIQVRDEGIFIQFLGVS